MASSWNATHSFDLHPASMPATSNDTAKLGLELFQKLLPSTILFTTLICLGIPGNLLVFVVYLKQFKVSSTRVFVLAMASCDLFVGIVTVPVHIIYVRYMYTVGNSFCRLVFLILKFSVVVSGWILVCASLDRRHRVCQPLRRQLSARQALYVLVVPLGLAILATVPFVVFHGEVKFTTSAGQVLKKCGYQAGSDFQTAVVKRLEGIVLGIYCIVGLSLFVWAYVHILYRLKWQNRRKHNNVSRDSTRANDVTFILSPPESTMELADTPETPKVCGNPTEERYQLRDTDSREESLDVSGINQQEQNSKAQTREAIQEGRQLTRRRQESRKSLASKTTRVIFLITVTNALCLLPYIVWTQFHETYYEPRLKSSTINLVNTSNYLPSLRSTITPLIYICFNVRFRKQCRQFFYRLYTSIVNFRR